MGYPNTLLLIFMFLGGNLIASPPSDTLEVKLIVTTVEKSLLEANGVLLQDSLQVDVAALLDSLENLKEFRMVPVPEPEMGADDEKASSSLWYFLSGLFGFLLALLGSFLFKIYQRKKSGDQPDAVEEYPDDHPKNTDLENVQPANLADADPIKERLSIKIVPEKSAENIPHPLQDYVTQWRRSVEDIKQKLTEADDSTEVRLLLQQILAGKDNNGLGLEGLGTSWLQSLEKNTLNKEGIFYDLSRGPIKRSLAALYRLGALSDLPPAAEYLRKHKIDVDSLASFSITIFQLMSEHLDLSFQLPKFGSQYEAGGYDLVINNIATIGGIDNGGLLLSLQDWSPANTRPIIDVGELGVVPKEGTDNAEILNKFPKRTTVAYYVKN